MFFGTTADGRSWRKAVVRVMGGYGMAALKGKSDPSQAVRCLEILPSAMLEMPANGGLLRGGARKLKFRVLVVRFKQSHYDEPASYAETNFGASCRRRLKSTRWERVM